MNVIWVNEELFQEQGEAFLPLLPENFTELKDSWIVLAAVDEEEGYVCGVLGYQAVPGYEIRIQWLYVDEACRRKGVATLLLDDFYHFMDESGVPYPITMHVDRMAQDGLYEFVKSYGNMYLNPESKIYWITKEQRDRSKLLASLENKKDEAEPFFEILSRQQNKFLEMLENEDYYVIEDREKWRAECVDDLCLCVRKDNDVAGCVLVQENGDGHLAMSYLYSEKPEILREILISMLKKVNALYPDAILEMEPVSEASEKIVTAFFPDAKPVNEIYEALWNFDLRDEPAAEQMPAVDEE